jgi:hypothetical protein
VSEHEEVGAQMARRYGLPAGDTVRNAVASMTVSECSALIEKIK